MTNLKLELKLIKIEKLNKRWKKNERRRPESEQKMRYFKTPLCQNFV